MQEIVKDKKLYKYVDRKYVPNNWQEGNELIIDDKFKAYADYYFNDEPGLYFDAIPKEKRVRLVDKIGEALDGKLNKSALCVLAYNISHYLNNSPVALREYILESIRKSEFPDLISRRHCLYLFDEEGLDFWKRQFNNTKRDLYEVSVSGNLFSSYDCLIPYDSSNIVMQEEQARCYWKSDLKAYTDFYKHDYDDKEYLFQGKVKVLKKYR